MEIKGLSFSLLPGPFAVSRLEKGAPVPPWALAGRFFSVTGTSEELSVICEEKRVPGDVRSEKGWRCLGLDGPFDFSAVGIAESFVAPLAMARIGVLVVSTYDTDFLLVKEENLEKSIEVLQRAGHRVKRR